jgi:alkanesulfonate monooxygenase SsuD/methylene tetrahydromethanopterin reductase-like flavin-dependent oxidoreductase (luciferase family)
VQIHGEAVRVGVHAWQSNAGYDDLVDLWRRCEALGYDWISHIDHFRPMGLDDRSGTLLDGPTLLASLGAHTERIRCGMLVAGVTHRHPAIAANIATAIDHISGGRLEWGMGSSFYELEHTQYGLPFPGLATRLDMLDEACRILRGMWTEETFSFEGRHFRIDEAQPRPHPVQERLPLVIGGAGKRRTLRIIAEHADIWNTWDVRGGDVSGFTELLDVLAGHCADVGRDPRDIRKSITFAAILASGEAEAQRKAAPELAKMPEPIRAAVIVGTPEQCAERLRPYVDLGVGDFLLGAGAPFDHETIELVGREVAPALRAAVRV